MRTDKTTNELNDVFDNVPAESIEALSTSNAATTPTPNWSRRTFLKAAALGAATVAVLGQGSPSVLAHEDTKSSCTANDIEVIGGQIINEPCTCTPGGTFEAIAKFEVINQNNATRKCITLHLGPTGGVFGGKDFLLTTDPSGDPTKGSSNIGGLGTKQFMYAKLGTVSCNFGEECYTNSVIAFQTAQNQSDTACAGPLTKYPGGQCRRQTICITGFGATLTCATDATCSTANATCTVPCGGSLYLNARAAGGTDGANGTYTFSVTDPSGNVVAGAPAGSSSPQCFTIPNPTGGTYTLTVTDSKGCTRTATTTVSVSTLATPTLGATTPNCSGQVTYTVTNCDTSLTYTFKEVNCTTGAVIGTLSGNNGGCSLTHTFPQDGADHCVVVTVSNANGSCPVTSSPVTRRINAPVTVTLVQTAAGCNGAVTLTAAGQGGDGSYTYTFSGATGTVSGNTIVLQPQLNGVCRTVSVTATSAGCTSAPASYAFSQCVTTTACP